MLDPSAIDSTDEHRLDAAVTEIEGRLAPSADVRDPALDLVGDVIRSMQDLDPNARVGRSRPGTTSLRGHCSDSSDGMSA